jgi:hypothetical protein
MIHLYGYSVRIRYDGADTQYPLRIRYGYGYSYGCAGAGGSGACRQSPSEAGRRAAMVTMRCLMLAASMVAGARALDAAVDVGAPALVADGDGGEGGEARRQLRVLRIDELAVDPVCNVRGENSLCRFWYAIGGDPRVGLADLAAVAGWPAREQARALSAWRSAGALAFVDDAKDAPPPKSTQPACALRNVPADYLGDWREFGVVGNHGDGARARPNCTNPHDEFTPRDRSSNAGARTRSGQVLPAVEPVVFA